nr:NAD(P)-binding protein [Gammaproteobacteria bacterium]NIV49401.1 NAD(P)-binding protein [Gammaproteobacteria bacterium]
MTATSRSIDIAGAGLAGLSAAITAGRAGAHATVYERSRDVGSRFSGDFQGLENWTTEADVLEELAAIGIEPTFDCVPYYETVLFDPDGRAHECRDSQPIFYLVERGPGESTIDRALYRQARAVGVDVLFQSACGVLPEGGIVACGPRRADVIAVGYLFETDAADGAYCSLSPKHSREGYAYLLVRRGRGVVATCLFADFHNERYYLGEAVEFFESTLGVKMRHRRRFGGAGAYSLPASAHRNGILLAGEAAGFQDAFAGFGMRYALVSGHLTADALLVGEPSRYDARWRARFGSELRAGLVNRYLYGRLGALLRTFLAIQLAHKASARSRFRRRYANSILKSLILPFARRALVRAAATPCTEPGCHCTWCRC